MSDNKKKTKKNNPLYVVTNKGKDVEAAKSFFDALIKRFGLGPLLDFLNEFALMLLKQINSYAMLVAVKKEFDVLVRSIEELLKKLMPSLFFYRT